MLESLALHRFLALSFCAFGIADLECGRLVFAVYLSSLEVVMGQTKQFLLLQTSVNLFGFLSTSPLFFALYFALEKDCPRKIQEYKAENTRKKLPARQEMPNSVVFVCTHCESHNTL